MAVAVPGGAQPRRRRWLRVIRITSGAILLLFAIVVPLASVDTNVKPVVSCGGPAVRIAVDEQAADAPSTRFGDCADAAREQVLGVVLLAGVPGLLLLLLPRFSRSIRAAQEIETARSRETGAWRMSVFARRLAAMAISIMLVVLGFFILLADAITIGIAAVLIAPLVVIHYYGTIRPSLVAGPELLLISNPTRRVVVRLADVQRAVAGYWGIVISQRSQPAVIAWVGQKTNWAVWRGKRTRADDIVDDIARRASVAQQSATSSFTLSSAEHEKQRTFTGKMMIRATSVVAGIAIVRVLLGR